MLPLLSCSIMKDSPGIALNEVKFSVSPYISNRDGKFYLIYQVDSSGDKILNRLVIGEKITNNKGYYFFIGKTSFREYDHLVLFPIRENTKIISLIEKDSVFWLNPNNSEIKLKFIKE